MDNWLYYIIVAGFFAISQVMEKRRKKAKKDGGPMAPPQQSDTSSTPKPQRKRPTNLPDSLDEVLAEMLGIPKQGKPVKPQPAKKPKASSTPKPINKQRIPTASPEPREPIAGRKERVRVEPHLTEKKENTPAYGSYTKPKSAADERNTPNNQTSSTKKESVNLRQAVIYQTILERKYS